MRENGGRNSKEDEKGGREEHERKKYQRESEGKRMKQNEEENRMGKDQGKKGEIYEYEICSFCNCSEESVAIHFTDTR